MTVRSDEPPVAAVHPYTHVLHGDERPDPYHWLRDREDPAVVEYLEAENAYAERMTVHTAGLREQLFDEIRSRILETDTSPPAPDGGYLYYTRTVEGQQYAIHCRRTPDGPEQILLDENVAAEGHAYFDLGALDVDPQHRLLAWAYDTTGDEEYTLRIRDLAAGTELPDEIAGIDGVAFADDRTLFYVTRDAAKRPYRLYRHVLGADPSQDVLVHQEDDERFYLSVYRTRTDAFVVMHLASKITSEVHVLDTGDPMGAFRVIALRRQGVEYDIEHQGDRFVILTNLDAEDFRLMEAPVTAPGEWRELIAHTPGRRLLHVAAFARHILVREREQATTRLRVITSGGSEPYLIEPPEEVSTSAIGENREYETDTVRFVYTSLVTPATWYDQNLVNGERTLVKQLPVLGGYEPSDYESAREWAVAPDGVRVPVSLVYRKGTPRDGTAPMLLTGYGAYETSMDPSFAPIRLPLIDRGVVVATAHVRGGGEMGRRWYEDGKLLNKQNTFTDFISCAEHLIGTGWTSADRLAISGGSAGGLLIGAVLNLRPDLFRAAVASVPFVDALSTICDPSLPLTVLEWEEWGNPVSSEEVYRYMRSYSPYENVREAHYPATLVLAGLNDPRVSYWEPAKWVARLRSMNRDGNQVLLKTEMSAGHFGPSGRYEAWRKTAYIYAFVLDALGLAEASPASRAAG